MMRKISSLLLCTALAAAAQILVETPEGFRPVGATYAMGSTSPGDRVDISSLLLCTAAAPASPHLRLRGRGYAVRPTPGPQARFVLPEVDDAQNQ
ncbi:MAG: hypothetical protein K7J47_14110 [Acidobacteria bacterium]|nr:hypothetical protein [Bryobacteraceae bacterium CoA2 C42]